MKDETLCKNQGISYNPPEGMENATLQEKLKDYYELSDDEMLKKYGILLTSEVWNYIWDSEDGNKKKNPDYFHD